MPAKTLICPRCKVEPKAKYGYCAPCRRECNREYLAKWRAKNYEKYQAYLEKRKASGRTSELARACYHRNPERSKAATTAWMKANKERKKEKVKEWYARTAPDRRKVMMARIADKLKATPKWADQEKIRLIYHKAKEISDLTGIKHHVDHIIPLRNKLVCGLNCEDNLQILTALENCKKSNKFVPYYLINYKES